MEAFARAARSSYLYQIMGLSFLAMLLVTVPGYTFGTVNQVNQIPLIFRAIDPAYLGNDFYVNTASSIYSHREYYTLLFVHLSRLLPLEVWFLLFIVVINTLIAVISALAANDLFGGRLASLLAIGLVMGLGFSLPLPGGSAWLIWSHLTPSQLIVPLLLVALWATIRHKPMTVAVTAGLAAMFHPLMGPATGSIGLFIIFSWNALQRDRAAVGKTILAGLVFLVLIAPTTLPYLMAEGERLSTEEFVRIVAEFRGPHHYLPSAFPSSQYLLLVSVVTAALVSLYYLRDRLESKAVFSFVMIYAIILLLCVAGYVFVEIIPVRLVVTLQLFRLLQLINWINLILLAGFAAMLLQDQKIEKRTTGYTVIISLVAPVTSGLVALIYALQNWARRQGYSRTPSIDANMLLILFITIVIAQGHNLSLLLIILIPLALLYFYSVRSVLRKGLSIAASVLLVGFIFNGNIPLYGSWDMPRPMRLDSYTDPIALVAQFARTNTPEDAIFIIPPREDRFRILAERAIVVDYKGFLVTDAAMAEWMARMEDVYGDPNQDVELTVDNLNANYWSIDDDHLLQISQKYDAHYAVLFRTTPTQFDVLFTTGNFKIVVLPSDLFSTDQTEAVLTFDDTFELLDFHLPGGHHVQPCGQVEVRSWWRAEELPANTPQVTFVLADEEGMGRAQSDSWLAHRTAEMWQRDEVALDWRAINVPCDLPAGEYPLLVSLYNLEAPYDGTALYHWQVRGPAGDIRGHAGYLTTLLVGDP